LVLVIIVILVHLVQLVQIMQNLKQQVVAALKQQVVVVVRLHRSMEDLSLARSISRELADCRYSRRLGCFVMCCYVEQLNTID